MSRAAPRPKHDLGHCGGRGGDGGGVGDGGVSFHEHLNPIPERAERAASPWMIESCSKLFPNTDWKLCAYSDSVDSVGVGMKFKVRTKLGSLRGDFDFLIYQLRRPR